ncbi:MAG: zinc-dependent metalloprotease, partial [Planctomycetota bacterium]
AIEYGYKPIPADREAEELARIAARCDEPDLAYATDGDARGAAQIDPEATIFDLSSDPVAWCRDRIGLCEDLWKADWSALNVEGFGYRLHRSAMRALLRTYRRSLEIAARWVGGTVTNRRHPGDEGAPFHNVPIHKQREALDLVVEKGLAPGLLRFPPELLNRLAVNRFRHWGLDRQTEYEFPLHQRIREMRLALLRRLHGQAVLRHMDEARSRALPGEPAMTIREVLERVREAVWSGVAGGGAVPADRRDLQADHVEILAQLFLHPESYPRDAHVLARSLLRDVTSLCARALKAPELEVETRAHLQAVSARVQAVLGVSLSRAVR